MYSFKVTADDELMEEFREWCVRDGIPIRFTVFPEDDTPKWDITFTFSENPDDCKVHIQKVRHGSTREIT
jgi:hypothetical protein